MASKSNMTLRIEPELKEQAAALFKSLGLDLSTATGIFYRQALRYHGLPFEIRAMKNRMKSLMRRWKQRKTVKICTALLIALQK